MAQEPLDFDMQEKERTIYLNVKFKTTKIIGNKKNVDDLVHGVNFLCTLLFYS